MLPPENKSLAVVGDLQMTSWLVRATMRRESNHEAQQLLIEDLRLQLDDLAAVALVGDLVFNVRSRRDWLHFDALMNSIAARVPLLPALGNHDYHCVFVELCWHGVVPKNARLRFPWLAPGEPYWVEYGPLALIFLDSETGIEAQGAWLTELLPGLPQRFRAAVVFVHRPPYTNGTTRGLVPALEVRQQLSAAFAGSDIVPLVISGHAHGYEHLASDGIHYLVSAGGGGPRGWLSPLRPLDVYRGPNCETDAARQIMRPFNYLLVNVEATAVYVEVRGFCKNDPSVRVLESFRVPFAGDTPAFSP